MMSNYDNLILTAVKGNFEIKTKLGRRPNDILRQYETLAYEWVYPFKQF